MKNIPEYHYKHNKKSNTLILSASDIEKHASDFLQEYSKSNTNYSFLAPQATPLETNELLTIFFKESRPYLTITLLSLSNTFSASFISS